jgi:glycosyltransferase involved in cell wall biosynthesis
MAASFSVLLPTRCRPDTLATALSSVQRQTGADIREIIVSENSSDTPSEALCRELADPRIRFVRQQPECGPQEHLARLFELATSEWLAILHDDDWWLPGHLATLADAIAHAPSNLSAAASHCIYVDGEINTRVHSWGTDLPLRLALDRPIALDRMLIHSQQMLALCRVYTPIHFSALAVRREVALYTRPSLLGAGWYNADRLWYPALAARGPIVFDPLPSVLIRWHSGNWAAGQSAAPREAEFLAGCRTINELANQGGHDLDAFWRNHLKGISSSERRTLAPLFARAYPEGSARFGDTFPKLTIPEQLQQLARQWAAHLRP